MNLALFILCGYESKLNKFQWVCWIWFLVGVQIIQWFIAWAAMGTCRILASLERQDIGTQFLVILLLSAMLLGGYCCLVFILSGILDEFPETQMPFIKVIVRLNGALCFVC